MNKFDVTRREIAHFGAILSNISVATLILTLISVLGLIIVPMFYVGYFLILVIITVFTLGLVLADSEFRSLYSFNFHIDEIAEMLAKALPVLGISTLVLLALSLICLLFDPKWKGSKSRILYASITLGIVLTGFILIIVGIIGGNK